MGFGPILPLSMEIEPISPSPFPEVRVGAGLKPAPTEFLSSGGRGEGRGKTGHAGIGSAQNGHSRSLPTWLGKTQRS